MGWQIIFWENGPPLGPGNGPDGDPVNGPLVGPGNGPPIGPGNGPPVGPPIGPEMVPFAVAFVKTSKSGPNTSSGIHAWIGKA